MSKIEKEKQGKIACPRKMYKEFDKEKDMRSILHVKALIAYCNGIS